MNEEIEFPLFSFVEKFADVLSGMIFLTRMPEDMMFDLRRRR